MISIAIILCIFALIVYQISLGIRMHSLSKKIDESQLLIINMLWFLDIVAFCIFLKIY